MGFTPGGCEYYRLAPPEKQLEVPKYLRPRTDTPSRTLLWGGCFGSISVVRSPGGYQMLGRVPVPLLDWDSRLPDFNGDFALHRPADVLSFRQIDRAEYDEIRAEVAAGSYRFNIAEASFLLDDWEEDWKMANDRLLDALR
jgi:urea carboxylase